jgi:hypothetical protein
MSLTGIYTAIKTQMEAVTGMGIVHDYVRWSADWKRFLDLYKTTGNKINGWAFGRTLLHQRHVSLGAIEQAHVILFRGVYGLDDSAATEKTFQAQIDLMVAKFNLADNEDLGGACLTINPDWGPMDGAVGMQVDKIDHRVFGTVLCHYAEARMCCIETLEC